MKFSFKLSPKTIIIGVVILVVVIYIGYVLYRRYYAEPYLQFSPGNETAFLMDGVENFGIVEGYKHYGAEQRKYNTQESQALDADIKMLQENFTPDAQDYPTAYSEPFGESSGTIGFGRWGSSFIV